MHSILYLYIRDHYSNYCPPPQDQVANTAQGETECCICHETPPLVLYFIVQYEYMVHLLICWFWVGGLIRHGINRLIHMDT